MLFVCTSGSEYCCCVHVNGKTYNCTNKCKKSPRYRVEVIRISDAQAILAVENSLATCFTDVRGAKWNDTFTCDLRSQVSGRYDNKQGGHEPTDEKCLEGALENVADCTLGRPRS